MMLPLEVWRVYCGYAFLALGPVSICIHLSAVISIASYVPLRSWQNFGFACESGVHLLVILTQYPTIVQNVLGVNLARFPFILNCRLQAMLGIFCWILDCKLNLINLRQRYHLSKNRYRSRLWRWQPVVKTLARNVLVSFFLSFLPFWDIWTNYVQEGEGFTCSVNFTMHEFRHILYIIMFIGLFVRCFALAWTRVPYIVRELRCQIRVLNHEGQRPISSQLYLYKDQLRRSANVFVTLITLVNSTVRLLCSLPYLVVLGTGVFNLTELLPSRCKTYAALIVKGSPILSAFNILACYICYKMLFFNNRQWIRCKLPHLRRKTTHAALIPNGTV